MVLDGAGAEVEDVAVAVGARVLDPGVLDGAGAEVEDVAVAVGAGVVLDPGVLDPGVLVAGGWVEVGPVTASGAPVAGAASGAVEGVTARGSATVIHGLRAPCGAVGQPLGLGSGSPPGAGVSSEARGVERAEDLPATYALTRPRRCGCSLEAVEVPVDASCAAGPRSEVRKAPVRKTAATARVMSSAGLRTMDAS